MSKYKISLRHARLSKRHFQDDKPKALFFRGLSLFRKAKAQVVVALLYISPQQTEEKKTCFSYAGPLNGTAESDAPRVIQGQPLTRFFQ